ncbi:hypothetical protein ACA910_009904 [Epithemia clementina (nom. ined.)]
MNATHPLGCDTFVAYPPTAPKGTVVFGKNSDRPQGEGQSIRRYPAARQDTSGPDNNTVQCTYIRIPQAAETYAVLLSQIDWMWGAENGANEHGVVIGNEAVWTNVPEEPGSPKLLLGMDLVRLGLERGKTAEQSMQVIIQLLEEHGQGGPCAYNDPSFTYHNSFLIADAKESWILETAGRHWCAKRVTQGGCNISNGLTIRTNYDLCSKGLQEYALQHKLWDGKGDFDFAQSFSSSGVEEQESLESRQGCGHALLQRHENQHSLDHQAMMDILRSHDGGICMHGGFETRASMVTEWNLERATVQHWMTGKPHPCQSEFVLQDLF